MQRATGLADSVATPDCEEDPEKKPTRLRPASRCECRVGEREIEFVPSSVLGGWPVWTTIFMVPRTTAELYERTPPTGSSDRQKTLKETKKGLTLDELITGVSGRAGQR